MKVIYVTAESYIDHSYTIALELQKHLDFHTVIQAKEENEEIIGWCRKINAELFVRKRFRNPLSFFSELGFLLRLRKMKADLVWFNTLTVYQALLAKLLIRKMIVTVHDVEKHPAGSQHHASLSLKLTFGLYKKNICVVSRTQEEIFRERFGFDAKVFQLPIITYFTECARDAAQVIIKGSDVRFFFFGSVEEYKGMETLLGAAEILNKKGLKYSLSIFGKLKYDTEELKKRISALMNVSLDDRFIDYRDIHSLYASNDVIILPYRQVTQCGPLLIGYNELTPAICSDHKGFREYADDGKSALIFDNTPEGLAQKMEKIISKTDAVREMKDNINTEIRKRFSMESLVEDYIKNFEHFL